MSKRKAEKLVAENIAHRLIAEQESARLAARVAELESAIAGAGEMHGELTEAYCARNASVVALTAELAEANRKLDLVLWECPECSFRFDNTHDHIDGSYSCPNCEEHRLAARVAGLRTAIEPFAKVEIDGWSNLEPEHFAAARAAYEAST